MAEVFDASVQYNDWLGTAAADNADVHDLWELLKAKKLLKAREFPVGISFWSSESHGDKNFKPFVSVYAVEQDDFDGAQTFLNSTKDPVPVRKIEVELSIGEFFDLFKRFEVCIARRDLKFHGREIETGN